MIYYTNWPSKLYLYKAILDFTKKHDIPEGLRDIQVTRVFLQEFGIKTVPDHFLDVPHGDDFLERPLTGYLEKIEGELTLTYCAKRYDPMTNYAFVHGLAKVAIGYFEILETGLTPEERATLEEYVDIFAFNILLPPKFTKGYTFEGEIEMEDSWKLKVPHLVVRHRLRYLEDDIEWTKEAIRRGLFEMTNITPWA